MSPLSRCGVVPCSEKVGAGVGSASNIVNLSMMRSPAGAVNTALHDRPEAYCSSPLPSVMAPLGAVFSASARRGAQISTGSWPDSMHESRRSSQAVWSPGLKLEHHRVAVLWQRRISARSPGGSTAPACSERSTASSPRRTAGT